MQEAELTINPVKGYSSILDGASDKQASLNMTSSSEGQNNYKVVRNFLDEIGMVYKSLTNINPLKGRWTYSREEAIKHFENNSDALLDNSIKKIEEKHPDEALKDLKNLYIHGLNFNFLNNDQLNKVKTAYIKNLTRSVLVSSSSLTVQLIKIQSLTNQISNDQLIKDNINENDFSKKHLIYLKHELLLSRLENLMRQGIYNDDFIDRYNLISNDVESEKLFENQTVAKVEEINKLTKAHKERYELIVKYKNQKMNDNIDLITLPRLPTNRRILH